MLFTIHIPLQSILYIVCLQLEKTEKQTKKQEEYNVLPKVGCKLNLSHT